jgi:hypothetical protein
MDLGGFSGYPDFTHNISHYTLQVSHQISFISITILLTFSFAQGVLLEDTSMVIDIGDIGYCGGDQSTRNPFQFPIKLTFFFFSLLGPVLH